MMRKFVLAAFVATILVGLSLAHKHDDDDEQVFPLPKPTVSPRVI